MVEDPVVIVATSVIVSAILLPQVSLEMRHGNEGHRDHEVTDGPPEDESEDGCHKLLVEQTSEDHDGE